MVRFASHVRYGVATPSSKRPGAGGVRLSGRWHHACPFGSPSQVRKYDNNTNRPLSVPVGLPAITSDFNDVVFLKLGVIGQVAVGNGIEANPLPVFSDASAADESVVFGADRRVSFDRDQQTKAGCCW